MTKRISEKQIQELTAKAKKYIPGKVEYYAKELDVTYGRVTIRHQKTRWGSCSTKHNLNFNCLLMLAPEHVREYVIVHEVSHLIEMNHSKRFWKLVEKMLPDYKESQKWLKEKGIELVRCL